jgi:PPOX class probable F420-dependent enzyme
MSALTMTQSEREAFLAELHVAVFAVARPGQSPLVAPVWYRYEPGGVVELLFAETSEKLRLVRIAGEASLCAQTEAMPYKYVTVEGPAVVHDVDLDLAHDLAHRYLGPEVGDLYLEATAGAHGPVVRLTPTRWRTSDYARFG